MASRSVLDVLAAVAPMLMQEPTYLEAAFQQPEWIAESCLYCDGEVPARREKTFRSGPFPHEADCPWVAAVAATGIWIDDDA